MKTNNEERQVIARERNGRLVIVELGNEDASITSDYSVDVGCRQ